MRLTDLRCEGRTTPIDLDTAAPHFGWTPAADAPGERQTAYQIRVADADDGRTLWDSGRVESNRHAARSLTPVEALSPVSPFCFWKVQAWNKDGAVTPWSEPAAFATAMFAAADWRAGWVGHAGVRLPLLRRAFAVGRPVRRAVVYVCGLGQFELHCNGYKAGDAVLEPGWTDYRKTCQYVAHDVTHQLHSGDNVLGVMLGNGMYHVAGAPAGAPKRYTKFKGSFGPPKMIAELHISYADGTHEAILTDDRWQTADGPLTFSEIYGGEDCDARLDPVGWDAPGFDAARWHAAVPTDGPGGTLRGSSHAAPPVRVAEAFDAVVKSEPTPGVVVYDAGQNCSMRPRLVVRGPAGATVKISPAESLKDDGTVNQKHTGSPTYFSYTLRGGGEETWSPRFAYTGGRYLQIETAPPDGERPHVVSLQSQHVTAAAQRAGSFACSNDVFNGAAKLIDWAIRSNTVSLLTDCPHREKLGWAEEQHLMGPSLMYGYDCGPLFRKICGDHTDAQLPNGDVPTICPQYTNFQPPWDVFNDSPEWGSAAVLVPWQAYRWYGDAGLLRRQYPTMRRYVDYLTSRAEDGIVGHGLGDWYDLGPNPPGFSQLTPVALTATAIYFHDLTVLARAATVLGRRTEADDYAAFAGRVKLAFNKRFYDSRTSSYATDSQTSLAMPLALGLVPDGDAPAVVENLVAEIRSRDNALTSGDVGYRYLLTALADADRSDVIFDMNCRSDRPGYGMMLAKGETSLTEAWDARPQSSLNHFMLGHIQEWFYGRLAGIAQAADAVAFDKIVIRPTPVGDVTHAAATYDSVRGRIAVDWRIEAGTFTLDCTVPPNTTATVELPGGERAAVAGGTHRFVREWGANKQARRSGLVG